jgi:hypothetical protein
LGLSDRQRWLCRAGHIIHNDQGVSHAKWPNDNSGLAPEQTGGILCCTLKTVDIECRPPRLEQLAKRAKKLRAVSGARPYRSPKRQYDRGRELLPARRTLFQIDAPGPGREVREFAQTAACGSTSWGSAMNEKQPTYRIEIKNSGKPPNENFGWKIYRNLDVLPILHSQQFFVSRMAGLADANRSRRQLVDADMQSQNTNEQ